MRGAANIGLFNLPWQPLAEHWNGHAWTVQATPILPDYQGNAPWTRVAELGIVGWTAMPGAVGSVKCQGG